MQPVDLSFSDRFKSDRGNTQRLEVIKREIPILDPTNKYMHQLILMFTPIAKEIKFSSKQLGKIFIKDDMTEQEKEVLTNILYNRKAMLA